MIEHVCRSVFATMSFVQSQLKNAMVLCLSMCVCVPPSRYKANVYCLM